LGQPAQSDDWAWMTAHAAFMTCKSSPNDDPAKGSTLPLFESEFLQTLDEALKQHAKQIQSLEIFRLGTSAVCSLDKFSELPKNSTTFRKNIKSPSFISAGNYDTPPLLDYPRTGKQLSAGRITTPADSVLGITVGAVSPRGLQSQRPKGASPVRVLAARRGTELRHQA